jgi:hypothetical protein
LIGYGYFLVAADMPAHYASHRLRLQLEYSKLLDWGEEAGISGNQGAFDKRMKANGTVVMAVLSEIRSLLKTIRTLSLKYDKTLETTPQNAITSVPARNQSIDEVDLTEYYAIFEIGEVKERRNFPRGMKSMIQFSDKVKSIGQGFGSIGRHRFTGVRWAMMDETKFEAHLRRLAQLTTFLHQTLGDDKMQILLEYSRENCMAVIQLTENVVQIKEMINGLQVSRRDPTVADNASTFSNAETMLNQEATDDTLAESPRSATILQRLAEFRAVNTDISHLQSSEMLDGRLDDLARLSIIKEADDKSRSLATWKGTNVWIEWKPYSTIFVDDSAGVPRRHTPENAALNARRLVALLNAKVKPDEFCIPGCVGYFDDYAISKNRRFGFVYQVSSKVGQLMKPISLATLLGESKPAPIRRRFVLAQQLATCLLYFHAVNWLHKSLRSASIIFLEASGVADITRPYISSFEYSRPDQNTETYQGAPETLEFTLYCHPDYLGGRPDLFRKTFDMYSLGIILLEIAWWKPAKEIFSGWEDKTVQKMGEGVAVSKLTIQQWLLKNEIEGGNPEVLEHVKDTMGDRYHNAVRACIQGLDYFRLPKDVDQTDPVIATLLQQAYLRLVVDALHGISV